MPDSKVLGRFLWHELLTTDPKAGEAFYEKVVGWKSEGWDMDASYRMFMTPRGPASGVMLLPEEAKAMGAPPHWSTYIGTPDVDGTASRAESMGARLLHGPIDVPGVGRIVTLMDPQGAVFSIYQPNVEMGDTDDPATLGFFSWHELATADLDAAWGFYSTLFGWTKTEAMDMGGEMGVYQMFGAGAGSLGGMYRIPTGMPAPPNWMPYAMVPDARAAAKKVTALGGKILNGPMQVPGGDWIVMFMDPQGAAFAVHSKVVKAKAAKAKAKKAAPKQAKPAPKQKPAKKKAAPKQKPAKKKAAPKQKPAKKKAAPKKKAPRRARRKAAPKRKAARRPAPKRKAAKRPARKGGARKKK